MRMSGTSQKEAERAFQQYNELSQNLKEQEKIEQEIYDLRKEGVPVTDESIVKLKERNNELETTNVNIQEELKVLEDSNKGNVKKLLLNKPSLSEVFIKFSTKLLFILEGTDPMDNNFFTPKVYLIFSQL